MRGVIKIGRSCCRKITKTQQKDAKFQKKVLNFFEYFLFKFLKNVLQNLVLKPENFLPDYI